MKARLVLLAAAAVVAAAWSAAAVVAEEEPAGGTATGILVAKGETWIDVKAEGAKEAVKYRAQWIGGNPDQGGGPDKATVEAIKKLVVPNLVKVVWKKTDEGPRIVSVEMIVATAKEGTVTGKVLAKGETWIDVKPEGGPTERYTPRWTGGAPKDGGGLDKAMIEKIAKTKVGDTVKVGWTRDERKRVVSLEVVASAPSEAPKGEGR
jgi:hypothetical protein